MIYFVIKLLIISVIAVNAAKQKCDMTEAMADECGKKLVIFGNRDFKIPKNDAELLKQCENIDNGLKCFKKYSKTCLDAFSSQVINIVVKNGNIMANKVCKDPDGRKELFEHMGCFQSDDHLSEVHICMDKYIVQMEHLANVSGDHRLPATCCAFHTLKACAREKASKVCENSKTVDYIGNIITEVSSELVSFACGKFKTVSDCDRSMDKKEWRMLKDLVASDDPKVIEAQKTLHSPFIALMTVLKQLREE